MDASITFRFPGVRVAKQETETPPSTASLREPETTTSDEQLIAQICEGSRESLAVLFHRYARTVRGVAYRVLRDPSEADDLVQDIFLLIHRLRRSFDSSKGPARNWILQMTYHRALTRRRYLNSRHFYTRFDPDDLSRELPAPETGNAGLNGSDDALARADLNKVFASLTQNQQQTLQLFFVEGYTLGEIAVKLNQTRGNVKNHYFRGLEKLRKEFFNAKLRSNSAV